MTATPSILQQPAHAPCVARIVFPPLDEPPLRNVASCALLRIGDGTVRFIRLTRRAWTPDTLALAERRLAFVDGGRPSGPLLKDLAHDVGDATLTLTNFALDGSDREAWPVRGAAHATVARDVACAPSSWTPPRARERTDALARRWQAELDATLAAFVAGLDPEACAVAREHGRFDTDLYNFLVRGPRVAWRRQFVRTFPVLVHAAVTSAPDALGTFLRDAVDAGRPLVPLLAARWAVSGSAVRALRGRPLATLGTRWQRAPHQLARILDAIRPEDRPGEDPDAWQRLNEAIAAAEELFRRPAESSPITLGWLRAVARRGFTAPHHDAALAPEAVAAIDRLRAALASHLAHAAKLAGPCERDRAEVAAAGASDRYLAALSPPRLASIARRYATAYNARREALDETVRQAGGLLFWPLLPAPLASADGHYRVESLASLADLRAEGAAQSLCIEEGPHLADLALACTRGEAWVLSIRDATTGQRRSTAELRAVRRLGVGAATLRIHQHKGLGNGRPTPGCVQALHETLAWANGPAGQRHRHAGARRPDGSPATLDPRVKADREAVAEALDLALGATTRARLQDEVIAGLRPREDA